MPKPSPPTRTDHHRRGIFWIGFLALLPLLIFAGFATYTAQGLYRAADEARLRDTARALAAAVDTELGGHVAAIRALASSEMLTGEVNAELFAARSRAVGEQFGGWIVLLDAAPDHRVLALSTQADQRNLPATLPPGSRQALGPLLTEVFEHGRVGLSDLFEGSVIPRQIITVIAPVIREGQPRRALALSFEPASLRALLARQDLPPGTFAAVADGQFRLLAHSDDPEGQRIGLPVPAWAAAAIAGQDRALAVGRGLRGHDNVYAIERLSWAPGWTVTVAQPVFALRASAWAAVRWLLAGGLAFALGLAVMVWATRRAALLNAWREAAALRAGRAEVERLHAGLPAIIYLREVQPDGTSRLIYRAGDMEAALGWPSGTFDGLDTLHAWMRPDWPGIDVLMARTMAEGNVVVEYRFRQPDGAWRWLRSRCRLLSRRADGVAEVVGYILDVTAEWEAGERLIASARLASLGEMAAGLAHEMKQPLQSISFAAELAQIAARRGDATQLEARLERIVQQAERTANMMDHLRRFARGAEDATPAKAVSLTTVVQGALELARSPLRDAEIELEVALGDPAPVILGQSVLLEQVLSNLLLNARDALAERPAGARRQIRITAGALSDGTVQLTVADTGGGIPLEIMPRLFEPFVTTKGPDKGTGLGLSICHGLLKGMGGHIEAHNSAEGAVFTITLPAALEEMPGEDATAVAAG